jgi:small-conductance mechanosensitive channel
VEEITIRDTYVRKRSGELVLVPNSFLFKSPIKVLTDLPKRRISLDVGVPYDADLGQAQKILGQALDGLESVDRNQRVDVFVTTFNESSIDFLVRWWSGSTPIEEHVSRSEVAMAIKAAFDREGIEIPFPQRTLSFGEPLLFGREQHSGRAEGSERRA